LAASKSPGVAVKNWISGLYPRAAKTEFLGLKAETAI
jgi:hypothetical protein